RVDNDRVDNDRVDNDRVDNDRVENITNVTSLSNAHLASVPPLQSYDVDYQQQGNDEQLGVSQEYESEVLSNSVTP
ncbi:MAG: hypothetical protein ACTH8Z_02285, partial [Psychrobacter sp.]